MLLAAEVLLAAGLLQTLAAEPKPIAAVAVASYNDLIGDINFVGSLADRPQLGGMADGLVSLATQFKGLTGVDKTRPWGAIIQADGKENIVGYVVVPITNFKQALGLLELFNAVDEEGGVYKLTPKDGKKANYVKQNGKWACFSDKPESLAHVMADPVALLNGVRHNYIVSGRVVLSNVPESLRQKFLAGLKNGIEKEAATKHDDESDEQFAARKKFLEQLESYLVRVAGDLDQINAGWALDRTAEKMCLDLSVTAKPGTPTADEMALAATAKTVFMGFRTADALSIWAFASPIPPAKQAIATSLLEAIRGKALGDIDKNAPEADRAAAKEMVGNALDLLAKIVKSGRIDAVLTSQLGPKAATGLGAVYVADGELFDKTLHSLVKAAETKNPEVAKFVKLDAATINGLNIHRIAIPVPQDAENRETVARFIGEALDIVIAVGKENVYFAGGRAAEPKLKQAIERSNAGEKTVLPIDISYAIKPLADTMAEVGKPQEQPVAKLAAAELKKSPGQDHLSLTLRPISNGVQLHVEVEQGLLRLFGCMFVMRTEAKPGSGAPGGQP